MESVTRDPASGSSDGAGLRRQLGLFDVIALHVGSVLGSGIFVAPAAVAAATAGTWQAAAFWALGGLVTGCGAACYAECGTRLPRPGGFYVTYREVYGTPMAFVGGWAALLVTYPASIAAIALVFGRYLGEVIPGLAPNATAPAAVALLIVGALNVLGVRIAAGLQRLLTSAKVIALAAVCLAAVLVSEAPRAAGALPAASPAVGGAAILTAIVVMLWTYDGWSDVSMIAGEVREPGRVLGRAVILGTGVLVLLYATVQLSVGALLPPGSAAGSERVVADAVEAGLGSGSARIASALVVLATFGSVHGIVLAASRLGFAMARDGVFFRAFGRVHPRFGTPARSVAALVLASLIYVFSAGFRNLLAFFSFTVWIFYGLTGAALLVLRHRRVGEPLAWRAPGGALAPAVVLTAAVGMTSALMLDGPRRSLAGLAFLLAGFPVYAVWRRLRRRFISG